MSSPALPLTSPGANNKNGTKAPATQLPADITELLDPITRTPLNRPETINRHELTTIRSGRFVKNRRRVNILDLIDPPVRADVVGFSSPTSTTEEPVEDAGFFFSSSSESLWTVLWNFFGYNAGSDDCANSNESEDEGFGRIDAVV